MGVTAGEVQAVLSAKDNMTPVMKTANEHVKELSSSLQQVGARGDGEPFAGSRPTTKGRNR